MKKDFELFDNKIIILYILDNSKIPLSVEQIQKFCGEFDDISYFDIHEYLFELEEQNLVVQVSQDNGIFFKITDEGYDTLRELLELIPGIDIYNLKKMVQKHISSLKQDYSIDYQIIPIKADEYKVSCYIKDGNDELINICLYAGAREQAKKIAKNWQNNAETIFKNIIEMMTSEEK